MIPDRASLTGFYLLFVVASCNPGFRRLDKSDQCHTPLKIPRTPFVAVSHTLRPTSDGTVAGGVSATENTRPHETTIGTVSRPPVLWALEGPSPKPPWRLVRIKVPL